MRLTLMFVSLLGFATLGATWAQSPKPKPSDPLAAVRKQLKQSQVQPINKVYRDKEAPPAKQIGQFHQIPMAYTPVTSKR